ncbi:MAG: inositol monophosphatase family protein [bacterium]|nr:inositol monophosphatase family protein [bacterium]MDE0415339.1 inositol monophosphatase family protein [bacterium]
MEQALVDELAEFAGRLADESGPIIRKAHQGGFSTEAKADGSPVTNVDRAVEDRLRTIIATSYPDHGIVGEERGDKAANDGPVWVIDPIDGTLPFLAGIPVFGTLIALVEDGMPLIGVIDMPATAERWLGCRGRPTTRNGAAVRVRACSGLADALLSTSNPDFYGADDGDAFARLKAAVCWTVYGGSCLAYAQLASGRTDLGIDVALDPLDYLALVPVIEGAGGVVSDWQGAPLTMASGNRILAAGDARRHAEAMAILAAN